MKYFPFLKIFFYSVNEIQLSPKLLGKINNWFSYFVYIIRANANGNELHSVAAFRKLDRDFYSFMISIIKHIRVLANLIRFVFSFAFTMAIFPIMFITIHIKHEFYYRRICTFSKENEYNLKN